VFGDGGTSDDGVEGKSNAASKSGVYGHHDGSGTGVIGKSASGPGVVGEIPASSSSWGVYGRNGSSSITLPTFTGVLGESNLGFGVSGLGSIGVDGQSKGPFGAGVRGSNTEGYGIIARGRLPLRIDPGATVGPPTSSPAHQGAVYVDANNDLYICVQTGINGTPGVFKKVAYGSGIQFLPAPLRILDTRGGAPLTNGGQKLPPGPTLTLPITANGVPAGATGIVGTIAVTNPLGAGFLKLFPGQLEGTSTSVINFVAGQTLANAVTIGLSPSGTAKVQASGAATDVILDITGYTT
jgi:hypothetical protein